MSGSGLVVFAPEPNAEGVIVMSCADYDANMRCATDEERESERWDETSSGDTIVLHPRSIRFDDPRVLRHLA